MDGRKTSEQLDPIVAAAVADPHKTLVIAGDLTCKASEKEYRAAQRWLCGLLEQDVRIVLAAGNHDTSKSIVITRVRRSKGFQRYQSMADHITKQSIVVARRDAFDIIYKVDQDVFFTARSTHHRLRKPTRIKRKQFEWAKQTLEHEGLLPEYGYRLHLVTHHSLWRLPFMGKEDADKRNHMHRRNRLRRELLEPLGFSTVINGHNHKFNHGIRPVKKNDSFLIYHIQAPTVSEKKAWKRGYKPGYVTWDPRVVGSEKLLPEG